MMSSKRISIYKIYIDIGSMIPKCYQKDVFCMMCRKQQFVPDVSDEEYAYYLRYILPGKLKAHRMVE